MSWLIVPTAQRSRVVVYPDEREGCLRLQVRDRSIIVVSSYGLNSCTEYTAFLESLLGVIERSPHGDSIVLLGDFSDSDTSNSLPDWHQIVGLWYQYQFVHDKQFWSIGVSIRPHGIKIGGP